MKESRKYPKEIQKYLESGININSDHIKIKNKAINLIGNIIEPIKKARILFEFVRDEIDGQACKNLKASEVLSSVYGMCYEKADLLTTLCRSAGIPATFSFDKIYIKKFKDFRKDNEIRDIQFFHDITEMYLNEKWIKYDPIGDVKRWKIWIQDDPVDI